jgi:hemoglobin
MTQSLASESNACAADCGSPQEAAARAPATAASRVAPTVASHAATDEAQTSLANAPQAAPNPHFARIGGVAGIERLAERFYFHMRSRPDAQTILAMHQEDLGAVQAVLVRFLTYWMGGPQDYASNRAGPRLRKKHLRFAIGAQERDAWLDCMRLALADTVADADLRSELDQAFSRTADFIRNDRGTTHDHYRHDPAGRP